MSAKAIREYDGKKIIYRAFQDFGYNSNSEFKSVLISPSTLLTHLPKDHPWLTSEKLVVKPDQLIKRRGKLGLVKVNLTYSEACQWIEEKRGSEIKIGNLKGKLEHFIIEPFCSHWQDEEYYMSIYSVREGSKVLFYHEGGVDVGDVDVKAESVTVFSGDLLTDSHISVLLKNLSKYQRELVGVFLKLIFNVYYELHFTYLEINPFVVKDNKVHLLDLAAKLDETARFEVGTRWGDIDFPAPFGRMLTTEEVSIADLDAKTGASLKLVVLNKHGRIWTMVAGGGASVVYADTICDLGFASELANYGEYSGAPSTQQTYQYAKTILSLMCAEPHSSGKGKVLIVGGGIANFTNVAETFKGLVMALREFDTRLKRVNGKIYVRRGGPNYQEGLRIMRELNAELSVPIEVYGPETHMTAIVSLALDLNQNVAPCPPDDDAFPCSLLSLGDVKPQNSHERKSLNNQEKEVVNSLPAEPISSNSAYSGELFTRDTTCLVYGMQTRAVQGMLDFDYMCLREKPSVAGMVYPFGGFHTQKFYWGTKEILLPVYPSASYAIEKHPSVTCVINFSSFRSAYDSTSEIMKYSNQIKVISIIAEGIPEKRTKELNRQARMAGVTIIGPATVGGIKPGCFRIGNTGGMLDNILAAKLYRPGCVAYVSRSGGMSNELNNIISRNADGVFEGIAIGGDRFPGSTFIEHLLRYEKQDGCKMMVLLGEVGGVEEYAVCEALSSGAITKPVVAWCIGTCASQIASEIQFGHAGALANDEQETAVVKNRALKQAGAHVPESFDSLGTCIHAVYCKLLADGVVQPLVEPSRPTVPIDYAWAQQLGLIRKPTSFLSSISDERGEELIYCNMTISQVMEQNLGIGGTLSLLWMKKRLPDYAHKFIEMCLIITADHGPAVSGAHNTIVTARAGKDLISSIEC
ncbi:ATP-citrate synthase-like isoform X2 [Zophobas morio]|uniref:ATP-citrate synthase-like isoform X2 n=1 Tax=Zophobas morio TaxID=2755281 RepID=UPI00308279AC